MTIPFQPARVGYAVALTLALLAPASHAGGPTTVDSFTGGANQGGWLFFAFPTYFASGGHPDAYIGTTVSSKLPQVTTSGPSVFTGDYRLRNVTSVGIDLLTESTGMAQLRPLTFMLTSNSCSVFVVGPELVPTPADGWLSFDRVFDPQSPALPAGWQVLGACADADAAWNAVIQNVTQIAFFWGDPLAFSTYALDQWVLGADNPRLSEQNPWLDLGGASPGSAGVPELLGAGLLTPGSPVRLELYKGPADALAVVWLALAPAPPVAAVGGTLHALPSSFQVFSALNGQGRLSLASSMPAAPSGTELTFQIVAQDPGTLHGLVLSNGVRGAVP